jgi:hypothetical protein
MHSAFDSYQILMIFEFSRHIFEKYSNINFYETPSSGSRVVPCGRTDRHDEANSRFSKAPKNHQSNNSGDTAVAVSLLHTAISVLDLIKEEVNLIFCPVEAGSRKIVAVCRFQVFAFLSW